MAQYDRVIPPGGEGKVTLKVRTRGYQGKVLKTARVYSNDPTKKSIVLRLTGVVRVPILLTPRSVYLYGVEGQTVSRSLEVRAQLARPLTLAPLDFNLEGKLDYAVEEIEKGRRYRIRFTNLETTPKSFTGFLKLKTNYPEKPEITVWLRGRIRKKAPPRQRPAGGPPAGIQKRPVLQPEGRKPPPATGG